MAAPASTSSTSVDIFNNHTDVGPYRPDAAATCWNDNVCKVSVDIMESCYTNVGDLTDPNDKDRSIDYQWCMCGQMGNWYQPPVYVKNIFVFCTICLEWAGVSREVTKPMNVTMDNYCLSPDANMYLLLTQMVNFTDATLPKPSIDTHTTSAYTYPWPARIRSLSTLAPLYTPDPFANRIWLLDNELSTTYTSLTTLTSANETQTITRIITTIPPSASAFLAPDVAASQIAGLAGSYSMQPGAITYMTTEAVKTTSTIATKGEDAIVLVGDAVPRQQTVMMITQTFGMGVRETATGTLTVARRSEVSRLNGEGRWLFWGGVGVGLLLIW